MTVRTHVALLLSVLLALLPGAVLPQFPIDPKATPVKIFEILDAEGLRLGTVVVACRSHRGYRGGYEYWRLDEGVLRGIAEQPSLAFTVLAAGAWDDPWVLEALAWEPAGATVSWRHPAEVAWTAQAEAHPPVVPGGIYFGNATLGGLLIQYTTRGDASLTWFKSTEGAFMQLEDGAVFKQADRPPTTGSWWHGPIDTSR